MSEVEDVATYIQRADLLDDLGRYAEAADELRQALRLEPDNPEALATLGLIQLRAGRAEQALNPVLAALATAPDHLLAQVVHGHVLAELDRRQEALDAADELLRVDPESWLRQLHFAAIRRRIRNGQQSLDAAWRAVQLAPGEAETHLVLAAVAEDLGLVDIAARARAEAARLDPSTARDRTELDVLRLRTEVAHPIEPVDPMAAEVDPEPAADLDPVRRREILRRFARLLSAGALYAWGSPLLVALTLVAGHTAARLTAAVAGVAGLFGFVLARGRLPYRAGPALHALAQLDRWLAAAAVAVLACPVLLFWYALTGSPWPLGVVVLIGAFVFTALVVRLDGEELGFLRRR